MTQSTQKRKNVITLIVIGCLVAIAAIVTTTVLLTQNNAHTPVVTPPIDTPDPPVVQTMKAPVAETEVGLGYAVDKLIYSETMKLWQTHAAIDFKAEKGTSVTAVLDGTVTKVANDKYDGIYVVITHADGKVTTYKSLAEATVKEGDAVKQGDAIGTVGDTMLSELKQGPHLHFELAINGKPANPADYIDTLGGK